VIFAEWPQDDSQLISCVLTAIPDYHRSTQAPGRSSFKAMDQNADPTIYDAARLCSKYFGLILDKSEHGSKRHVVAEELRGRFHLWAAYVGAFAAPKASLDARLNVHTDIKGMVLELLDMLQMNLHWGTPFRIHEFDSFNTLKPSKLTLRVHRIKSRFQSRQSVSKHLRISTRWHKWGD
jgi:hypothetical protein